MESRVIYTKNRIYWSNASVRNFKTYYDRTFSSQEFNIKEICNKSSYIKVSCISFLAYQDVMRFTVCEQSIKVTITSDLINFESLVKDYLI